jgi:SHS2 domain-containing protein
MFACFTAPVRSTAATQTVEVDVRARGNKELMMAWLEELLYQSEVKGLALHEFRVTGLTKDHLSGSAGGPRFRSGEIAVGPGVKAVTRHRLEVRRVGPYWRARIFFDV